MFEKAQKHDTKMTLKMIQNPPKSDQAHSKTFFSFLNKKNMERFGKSSFFLCFFGPIVKKSSLKITYSCCRSKNGHRTSKNWQFWANVEITEAQFSENVSKNRYFFLFLMGKSASPGSPDFFGKSSFFSIFCSFRPFFKTLYIFASLSLFRHIQPSGLFTFWSVRLTGWLAGWLVAWVIFHFPRAKIFSGWESFQKKKKKSKRDTKKYDPP